MGAFDWITELWTVLTSVIPHAILVRSTHGGVMFTRASHTVMKPGLHWYLPIWTETVITAVVRQPLNLASQSLVTKDHRTIVVSACVIFTVVDIEKLLVKTYPHEETIIEKAMAGVKAVITERTMEELQEQKETDKELTKKVKSSLKPFGVEVLEARLTDFAPARAIRLFTDGADRTEEFE